MSDMEMGLLLRYAFFAFVPLSLFAFFYFQLRTPAYLRLARPAPRVIVDEDPPDNTSTPKPRTIVGSLADDRPRLGFDLIDDPLEELDDAIPEKLESQPQSDQVEFLALAPRRVPSGEAFRIFINVQKVPDTSGGKGGDEETFDTLVTQVQRGERLSLVLESRNSTSDTDRLSRLSVDAPYQALTWKGGNLVIDFRARAPIVDDDTLVRSRLWITAGNALMGLPILKGKLDIAITVHSKQGRSLKGYQLWQRDPNTRAVSHKEIEAHFELARLGGVGSNAAEFTTAFICYAHDDKSLVDSYIAALEAASIRCHHDEFDFIAKPHWLLQAARFITKVDVIYIFWSRTASQRPSIESELKVIHAMAAARERENEDRSDKTPARPKAVIFAVLLDDVEVMLPDWFKEDVGYARRIKHIDAGGPNARRKRPKVASGSG